MYIMRKLSMDFKNFFHQKKSFNFIFPQLIDKPLYSVVEIWGSVESVCWQTQFRLRELTTFNLSSFFPFLPELNTYQRQGLWNQPIKGAVFFFSFLRVIWENEDPVISSSSEGKFWEDGSSAHCGAAWRLSWVEILVKQRFPQCIFWNSYGFRCFVNKEFLDQ